MELGTVGVIASVAVNGHEVGTVWTTPWNIDLTGIVKPVKNQLSIKVTNTWNNRLVADTILPPDQCHSYITQPYTSAPKKDLLPSGLLGPVRVLRGM